MHSSSAVRLLLRGLLLGLLCVAIGGLLLIVNDVAAYVMLGIGAVLLLVMPFVAAVVGAERHCHSDPV